MSLDVEAAPTRPVTNGRQRPNLLKAFGGSDAQGRRARARARVSVAESVGKAGAWLLSKARRARAEVGKPAERHGGTFLWGDPAESCAEHWAYLRAGAWSDMPLLIILGRAYGAVAFVPCAVLLAAAWIGRRPSRLLVASAVGLICWLTV